MDLSISSRWENRGGYEKGGGSNESGESETSSGDVVSWRGEVGEVRTWEV